MPSDPRPRWYGFNMQQSCPAPGQKRQPPSCQRAGRYKLPPTAAGRRTAHKEEAVVPVTLEIGPSNGTVPSPLKGRMEIPNTTSL
jgi:hypothetical protein